MRRWLPWIGLGLASCLIPWGIPVFRLAAVQGALFVLVLLPGIAVALGCTKAGEPVAVAWADVLLGSAGAAYGVAILYFFWAGAGRCAAYAVLGTSAAICAIKARQPAVRLRLAPLAPGLLACLGAGLLATGCLVLYGGAQDPLAAAGSRYLASLPGDPVLPLFFSERWQAHAPVRPFVGDWLSSDRPPLQSAFHLLVSPLLRGDAAYEAMGTVLQSWALLGLWSLLELNAPDRRRRAIVVGMVLGSGFFLFNTTFVWPKLLPAAYLLAALALLLGAPSAQPVRTGLLIAFALLGHGGTAFALLGLVLWQAAKGFPGGWRHAGRSSAAMAAVLLPWWLYQTRFDPPGNRLLKWHLAGVVPPDGRGLGATLTASYRSLTWHAWLASKAGNLRVLFPDTGYVAYQGHRLAEALAHRQWTGVWAVGGEAVRFIQFYYFCAAPGFLLVGAAGLIWPRSRPREGVLRQGRELVMISALVVAVWCLLMFLPKSTVNHQGTYFANLCLFAGLALGLCRLPNFVVAGAALLQVLVLIGAWVLLPPRDASGAPVMAVIQWPAAGLALAGAVLCGLSLATRDDPGRPLPG